MDISKLTIGEAREIAAIINGTTSTMPASSMIKGFGRKVIVRSREQGVNYGCLDEYSTDGAIVKLTNAKQIWSWTASEGGTLIDCATHGISKGKVSSAVSSIIVIGACAIIDVSEKAIKSLDDAKWA